jgi:hypothetical protein
MVGIVLVAAVAIIVDVIITVIVVVLSAFRSIPFLIPQTKSLMIVILCWQLSLRGGVVKLIPSSTISTIERQMICT